MWGWNPPQGTCPRHMSKCALLHMCTTVNTGYNYAGHCPQLTFDVRGSEINFMQEKLALLKFEVKHEEQCRSF